MMDDALRALLLRYQKHVQTLDYSELCALIDGLIAENKAIQADLEEACGD